MAEQMFRNTPPGATHLIRWIELGNYSKRRLKSLEIMKRFPQRTTISALQKQTSSMWTALALEISANAKLLKAHVVITGLFKLWTRYKGLDCAFTAQINSSPLK